MEEEKDGEASDVNSDDKSRGSEGSVQQNKVCERRNSRVIRPKKV